MEGRACSCMKTRIQRKQANCKDTTKYSEKIKECSILLFEKQNIKQKYQISES